MEQKWNEHKKAKLQVFFTHNIYAHSYLSFPRIES